ncbi:hypothetical protein [Stratiformator vulcanicus]|uniref:Uncharacterized protein n=1 Tax=Stratiformator vulcanicus TaxID=2527980 RepID=A0A517R2Y3_9PLAN|nr:hypothetical protein [Stratiformator vulcanicus]QDT38250.1 hypothetical protein Pan189_26400 [Stratiformator vulcanicus]
MPTQELLDDFYSFAQGRISDSSVNLSLDDIYQLWRSRKPTPDELSNSIEAVSQAYSDHEQGDEGEPAEEALRTICAELGLVID